MDLTEKYREQLAFLATVSDNVHDPLDRALRENAALMAKVVELNSRIDQLEEINRQLRSETNSKADTKKDNPLMPTIMPTDKITRIANFRDGSHIDCRQRANGQCDHWFSTKVGYIAVRSTGVDRYSVYVDANNRAALESQYRSLAGTLSITKAGDILCVTAYKNATGKNLF